MAQVVCFVDVKAHSVQIITLPSVVLYRFLSSLYTFYFLKFLCCSLFFSSYWRHILALSRIFLKSKTFLSAAWNWEGVRQSKLFRYSNGKLLITTDEFQLMGRFYCKRHFSTGGLDRNETLWSANGKFYYRLVFFFFVYNSCFSLLTASCWVGPGTASRSYNCFRSIIQLILLWLYIFSQFFDWSMPILNVKVHVSWQLYFFLSSINTYGLKHFLFDLILYWIFIFTRSPQSHGPTCTTEVILQCYIWGAQ